MLSQSNGSESASKLFCLVAVIEIIGRVGSTVAGNREGVEKLGLHSNDEC